MRCIFGVNKQISAVIRKLAEARALDRKPKVAPSSWRSSCKPSSDSDDQHHAADERHHDPVELRFMRIDHQQEESSGWSCDFCQVAQAKHASIKGLLVRHRCQIRFLSPSLFSFILYNSSSGNPPFVPRKILTFAAKTFFSA